VLSARETGELAVQAIAKKMNGFRVVSSLCAALIVVGLRVPAASGQDASATAAISGNPAAVAGTNGTQAGNGSKPAQQSRRQYYVDFRARTAASYGHAFVWYGRVSERKVEVAGLHPASDSVIPYILGHLVPVPSETGASYGDLDEQYLTASYRVFLSEPEAKRVFAYIKRLQESSPLWHAPLYNCVAFIRDIAQFIGLRVPASHLLYPEDWVNELRALNSSRRQKVATAPRDR